MELGFTLGGRIGGRRGVDFSGASLPPGAALTRASAATQVGADRRVQRVGADVARFDHDPASGRRLGLLVEPAAVNYLSEPHNLTLVPWARDAGGTGSAPVLTPGQAAPDGSTGAVRIDFARGDGFSRVRTGAILPTAGRYCFSIWSRTTQPGPSVALRIDGVDSGTLILGSQWQRVSLPADVGTAADVQILLWAALANAPITATVDLWGAQFEQGGAPTSLIEGSRAADALMLDWRARGVADGPLSVRYRLADGSRRLGTQMVIDGQARVPGDLPGLVLRGVERR